MVNLNKYLKLQIKEAFRCLLRGGLFIVALFAVSALLIFAGYNSSRNTDDKLITVAIVYNKDDFVIDSVLKMAMKEDSIKSFCNFEKMNYEEAMSKFSDKKADIVMIVPDDFYELAASLQETSITIIVPSDPTPTQKKLIAIIDGIESMMITTEGALYAMYDGMGVYSFPVTTSQMEAQIFEDVINQFLNRAELFEYKTVSLYGDFTFVQFFIVSAVMLIILVCSVTYFDMYGEGVVQLERIAANSILKKIEISIIKIVSMMLPIGILLSIMVFAFGKLFGGGRQAIFNASAGAYLSVWIFAFSASVFIHLIISIFGNTTHTKTLYILLVIVLLVISGVIVPSAYLPRFIFKVSDYIPVGMWQKILMNGLWNSARRNMAVRYMKMPLITDVILGIVSIYIYIRRLNLHD